MSVVLIVTLVAGISIFLLWNLVFSKKRKLVSTAPPEGSLRDPVTGLYNQKHLHQRLREYSARSERDKKPFALILWDINAFGKFNNEFGTKHGDRLLRDVADTIKRSIRTYDEAFRAGPDEFCAVLSPADEQMAEVVLDRVNQTVLKNLFEGIAEYKGHGFSLSSGFVFYPYEKGEPESLLHAARQALYKSQLTRSMVV